MKEPYEYNMKGDLFDLFGHDFVPKEIVYTFIINIMIFDLKFN